MVEFSKQELTSKPQEIKFELDVSQNNLNKQIEQIKENLSYLIKNHHLSMTERSVVYLGIDNDGKFKFSIDCMVTENLNWQEEVFKVLNRLKILSRNWSNEKISKFRDLYL